MRVPLVIEGSMRRLQRRFTPPLLISAMALLFSLGCRERGDTPSARTRPTAARQIGRATDGAVLTRPSQGAGPQVLHAPADSEIPTGKLGASIRRGRALLAATRDSLPGHVGNRLRCTSCHLEDGRRAGALSLVGVYGRFPQYRSRNDAISLIEDRINDCFQRSMNGTAIRYDGPDMRDMVAYMAFLSRDVAAGTDAPGPARSALPALTGDTTRGGAVFAANCARCHGPRGEGTAVATPLWGAGSYNIGAGMARVRTAASFIKQNMPFGNANLTDQQAYDVAAYVDSRPRPDFPGKEKDWPRGNPPPDVPYRTLAAGARTGRSTKP